MNVGSVGENHEMAEEIDEDEKIDLNKKSPGKWKINIFRYNIWGKGKKYRRNR